MKIFGIGMNYRCHAAEMKEIAPGRELNQSEVYTEPVVFTKCDSALVTRGRPFFIPDYTNECEYEAELVVRICRMGRSISERFAYRYYDAVTVGVDFTARDLQRELRAKGLIAEMDTLARNIKGQFKYANRLNAKYTVVIGENELTCQLADGWYRGSCGAWGLTNQYGKETCYRSRYKPHGV